MASDDILTPKLEHYYLANAVNGPVERRIKLGVDTGICANDVVKIRVHALIQLLQKLRLLRSRGVREDRCRDPDRWGDHFGFLEAVDGRAVRRTIHSALCAIDRVVIVKPANRDTRRRARRREHRMSWKMTGVSDGTYDRDSGGSAKLDCA